MEPELRSKRTSLAGGLKITYIVPNVNEWECTLGPVARRNGVEGFIVNGHCTETHFALDNEKFYQAHSGHRHIATETLDPAPFTGGSCPSGNSCVWADAAFAKWEYRGTWNLGKIYETQWRGTSSGSTHRVGINFNVVSEHIWPYPGMEVNRVGQEKGWTYGNVLNTCTDATMGGVRILCQAEANYGSDNGDSGSPVFDCYSSNCQGNKNVDLIGIHFGRRTSNPSIKLFSPTPLIESHLGPIDFK